MIPTVPKFKDFISENKREECILGGGEDYELCFTSNKKNINKINIIKEKYNIKITKIGTITPAKYEYLKSGKAYKVITSGYDHFHT